MSLLQSYRICVIIIMMFFLYVNNIVFVNKLLKLRFREIYIFAKTKFKAKILKIILIVLKAKTK